MLSVLFYLPAAISFAFLLTSCTKTNTLVLTQHNLLTSSQQNKQNVLAEVIAGTPATHRCQFGQPALRFRRTQRHASATITDEGNPLGTLGLISTSSGVR